MAISLVEDQPLVCGDFSVAFLHAPMEGSGNGDVGRLICQSDSGWEGCRATTKSAMCGILAWAGVLFTMFTRTQSTSAQCSGESGYHRACAVVAKCLYTQLTLTFGVVA